MARFAVGLSLCLLVTSFALSQSDPQALTYAAQSIAAMTGGTAIVDVTLTGTVTRTVGSDVSTGPIVLYGKGQPESRVDMNLDSGNRSEIRNSSTSFRGEWIGSDGTIYHYPFFNCMTDPVWFFPALSSLALANDPNQVLSYSGLETLNGASVQHLVSVWSSQPFSTTDFYLDATTLLPVQIKFNAHPDNDPGTNASKQIIVSGYQSVNGVQVPTHIQQLLNGNVLLDVTVTSSAVNTGLSDSLFTIQ